MHGFAAGLGSSSSGGCGSSGGCASSCSSVACPSHQYGVGLSLEDSMLIVGATGTTTHPTGPSCSTSSCLPSPCGPNLEMCQNSSANVDALNLGGNHCDTPHRVSPTTSPPHSSQYSGAGQKKQYFGVYPIAPTNPGIVEQLLLGQLCKQFPVRPDVMEHMVLQCLGDADVVNDLLRLALGGFDCCSHYECVSDHTSCMLLLAGQGEGSVEAIEHVQAAKQHAEALREQARQLRQSPGSSPCSFGEWLGGDLGVKPPSAAESFAKANNTMFAAHNRKLMCWHIDLHGQEVACALELFKQCLECLLTLKYPGGILLTVLTGVADNNHIEEVVSLEWALLSLAIHKWGACTVVDGSDRAARVNKVLIGFVRLVPDEDEPLDNNDEANSQVPATNTDQVSSLAYAAYNQHTHFLAIDLHNLYVADEGGAEETFDRYLTQLGKLKHPGGVELRVITGKGLHSANGEPRIRGAIIRMANEAKQRFNVTWQYDGNNLGAILVSIPGAKDSPARKDGATMGCKDQGGATK